MTDFFNDNWTTVLADADGQGWHFRYGGGSSIRIRQTQNRAADWSHQIVLAYYGMTGSEVTEAWLAERATAWIEQYNTDLVAGLV